MDNNLSNGTMTEPQKPATDQKPKKRIGLAIMLCVLVLLSIGGALALGYLWGNKTQNNTPNSNTTQSAQTDESSSNNSTTAESNGDTKSSDDTSTDSAEESSSTIAYKPLVFDANAIVNGDEGQRYSRTISATLSGRGSQPAISAVAEHDDNKAVRITVRWSDLNAFYGTSNTNESDYYIAHFSQPITDIYIGGIGQMIGGKETIFYLMEDGTVEQTEIKTAAQDGDFTKHSKVDGLERIAKFYDIDAGPAIPNAVGGYGTSAAQDIDGKIYLLFHIN